MIDTNPKIMAVGEKLTSLIDDLIDLRLLTHNQSDLDNNFYDAHLMFDFHQKLYDINCQLANDDLRDEFFKFMSPRLTEIYQRAVSKRKKSLLPFDGSDIVTSVLDEYSVPSLSDLLAGRIR